LIEVKYLLEFGNKIVIHRITAIVMDDMALSGHASSCTEIRGQNLSSTKGEIVLFAKGDDNSCSLPGIDYPITERDFIGKVVSITNTKTVS
jgi:signal peptidase